MPHLPPTVVVSAHRQRGVTLIELMIGLFIMVLLLLAALPFGARWVDGNRQMHARSLLWEGVSQARAVALRNPAAQRIGSPAARLQLRAGQLEVLVPGDTTPLWSTALRSDVRLKLSDGNGFADAAAMADSPSPGFDCVNFDPAGIRLPGAEGCSDTDPALDRVAVGVSTQDLLYVDLL